MQSILVIDTKLMMYTKHHSRKPALGFLEEIATLSLKLLPHIHKVVFVKDLGKSKRVEIFPNYKGKRTENREGMKASEKARLKKFLHLYNNVDGLLRQFGSVISLEGIEADDLAAIIAKRLGAKHNIYLMSSDSDWSRFLTNPNTTMINPKRQNLVTTKNAEVEFGVSPEFKLAIDSITGVDKESVDGIWKLGMTRAVKFLEEAGNNLDTMFSLIDTALETKKYGMVLPEWATSTREVYERNSKIFEAHQYDDLSKEEQHLFMDGWDHSPSRSTEAILKISSIDLENPYLPSLNEENFFHLGS